MKLIEIKAIEHLSTNEKGSTHQLMEIKHPGMLLASRKAGAEFGNHWHQGKSPSKNPEKLLLLSGRMKVWLKHLDSGQEEEHTLESQHVVYIFPRVLHRFKALEDCQFLEFNSLEAHVADTFYEVE